jgi:hypothetical protein
MDANRENHSILLDLEEKILQKIRVLFQALVDVHPMERNPTASFLIEAELTSLRLKILLVQGKRLEMERLNPDLVRRCWNRCEVSIPLSALSYPITR